EVMLKVFQDNTTFQQWETFNLFDSQGRIIEMAMPSAVSGFSESAPDLLNKQSGNYQFLNDTTGLIHVMDYFTSTTAGETTAGGVSGYEQDEKLQQGELGSPILLNSTQYFQHSGGGATVDPTATTTVYRNTDGTGAETTIFAYTWFPNSVRMQSQTTKL